MKLSRSNLVNTKCITFLQQQHVVNCSQSSCYDFELQLLNHLFCFASNETNKSRDKIKSDAVSRNCLTELTETASTDSVTHGTTLDYYLIHPKLKQC